MADLDHTFVMDEEPRQAQARFRADVAGALERMGLGLEDEAPGCLVFVSRFGPGSPRGSRALDFLLPSWAPSAKEIGFLRSKAKRERITVAFTAEGTGTKVHVEGKTTDKAAAGIDELGRSDRWPANRNDPDWHSG